MGKAVGGTVPRGRSITGLALIVVGGGSGGGGRRLPWPLHRQKWSAKGMYGGGGSSEEREKRREFAWRT